MNLNNIKEGQEFKNYKELCAALDEPLCTGNKKKSQLKEFDRYFLSNQNKHKFKIEKLYDFPLEKLDKRTEGIYVKHIETILLQTFLSRDTNTVFLSYNECYRLFGFMNTDFSSPISEHRFLENNKDISYGQLQLFKNRSYSKFHDILNSAIKSLERRKLILAKKSRLIKIAGEYEPIIATNNQVEDILRIEKEVLNKFGFNAIDGIFASGNQNKYYKQVNESLYNAYGWESTFSALEIIYTRAFVPEALDENIVYIEQNLCNSRIVESLNKQTETHYTNYLEKVKQERKLLGGHTLPLEKSPTFKRDSVNYPDNFIEIQKKLTERFIKYLNN